MECVRRGEKTGLFGKKCLSLGWEDPRGGNGNPPQYSCLVNPTDRGPWWDTVRGVAIRHD